MKARQPTVDLSTDELRELVDLKIDQLEALIADLREGAELLDDKPRATLAEQLAIAKKLQDAAMRCVRLLEHMRGVRS
jgi:hypothetical protein